MKDMDNIFPLIPVSRAKNKRSELGLRTGTEVGLVSSYKGTNRTNAGTIVSTYRIPQFLGTVDALPLSLQWVKQFGYYNLSKSSIFLKC